MKRHFTLPRLIEIVLGLLFLLAAYLKAKDPNLFIAQIYGYGVITDKESLRQVAIFATSIEAALGLALTIGLRLGSFIHFATQAMLLFYTSLIAYAWAVNGLEDCGCFGDVKIPPQMGILKNLIMMGFLWIATKAIIPCDPDDPPAPMPITLTKLVSSLALGIVCAMYIIPQLSGGGEVLPPPPPPPVEGEAEEGGNDTPDHVESNADPRFIGITGTHPLTMEDYDLAKGQYIVAMLNMDCDHCKEAVPVLNDMTFDPNLPTVVAICWEPEPGKMDEFMAETGPQFAMHSIGKDFLRFSEYIGSAPPRISILIEGVEQFYWDKEPPTIDEVYLKLDELSSGE